MSDSVLNREIAQQLSRTGDLIQIYSDPAIFDSRLGTNGVEKVIYRDADGNEFGLGGKRA